MNPRLLLFISALFSLAVGCESDKPATPVIPNEEEVITRVELQLIDSATADTLFFRFSDLDGEGGNAPQIEADSLMAQSTYYGQIFIWNDLTNPITDVAAEVEEEGDEHQFFYIHNLDGLDVNYNDQDAQNRPIGLETIIQTHQVESGELSLILRHQPNKDIPEVQNGELTLAGGETDVQIDFHVEVR